MKKVVITGGQGGLAQVMASTLQPQWSIETPGREKLSVNDQLSVNDYFADLEPLDILICNAGAVDDTLLLKMSEHSWDELISVNLKGAFLCAKAAAAKMVKQRSGHIVFIGSYSAFYPHIGQAHYAAAKAGLIGLTKSLAKELGGRGVRVNMIVPGWLETRMTESVSEENKQAVLQQHCLQQFNTPEAVAEFLYTLETKMPFTSGQIFHLDSRILP